MLNLNRHINAAQQGSIKSVFKAKSQCEALWVMLCKLSYLQRNWVRVLQCLLAQNVFLHLDIKAKTARWLCCDFPFLVLIKVIQLLALSNEFFFSLWSLSNFFKFFNQSIHYFHNLNTICLPLDINHNQSFIFFILPSFLIRVFISKQGKPHIILLRYL